MTTTRYQEQASLDPIIRRLADKTVEILEDTTLTLGSKARQIQAIQLLVQQRKMDLGTDFEKPVKAVVPRKSNVVDPKQLKALRGSFKQAS